MAWSIATVKRGSRPDFTLQRKPPNEHVTPAQQWFIEQLLLLESGTEDVDGGAYAPKPGYHDTVAGNDKRVGKAKDYSARDPQDRRGPFNKTRGRDWTFRDAQAGNFRDFAKYGDRILAAYHANDPRLKGWREYLGRVSKSVRIGSSYSKRIGIDFRHRYLRIPDDSHDWHGHFSESTEHVESFWNKWAMLTVLAGWSQAEWAQSIRVNVSDNTEEDDMVPSDLLNTSLGRTGPTVGVALQSGYRNTVELQIKVAAIEVALTALATHVLDDVEAQNIASAIESAVITAKQEILAKLEEEVMPTAPELPA